MLWISKILFEEIGKASYSRSFVILLEHCLDKKKLLEGHFSEYVSNLKLK